jgi:sugar-specific transcriptional regulator TrmB
VFEKPLKFIATPFRKAIDILIEARKMKIRFLEQKKQTLINAWLSLPQSSVQPERKEAFQVLEGQEQIDLKANEFLEQARNEVIVFAPKADLARLYYSSLLDKLERCSKKNVAVRLLTENSPNSRFFLGKSKLNVRYSSASDIEGLPGFVVADQEQLLLSMTKNGEESKEFSRGRKVSALATNYGAFIRVLRKLFAELWRSKEQLKVAPVSLA